MFSFEHSQITQRDLEQLAEVLLVYPMISAASKFDVAKVNLPLHLSLRPDAIFKKQRASKVPIHLQDKVQILLDILYQNEINSLVFKKKQPKGNTFTNPVITLAKG